MFSDFYLYLISRRKIKKLIKFQYSETVKSFFLMYFVHFYKYQNCSLVLKTKQSIFTTESNFYNVKHLQ